MLQSENMDHDNLKKKKRKFTGNTFCEKVIELFNRPVPRDGKYVKYIITECIVLT